MALPSYFLVFCNGSMAESAMQYRTAANSVVTIAGFFSLIGWLGPHILKFIDFLQSAERLREMMNLIAIKGVSISWPGIYLLGFVASAVGGIAINWDLAQQYYRRKRDDNYRDWNINGCDAIHYIMNNSLLGQTFLVERNRCQLSIDAFYEAAKTKKIRVAGRAEGSMLLDVVPKRTWNGKNHLDYERCVSSIYKRTLNIRCKDNEKILYSGLMADRSEILRTWPEAPIQRI